MSRTTLESVTERNAIVRHLTASKDLGLTIGICARTLGEEMVVTCVEELALADELVVILKPYDASGSMLSTTTVRLSDIESVLQFSSTFKNPFYKTIVDVQPITKAE